MKDDIEDIFIFLRYSCCILMSMRDRAGFTWVLLGAVEPGVNI